MKIHSNYLHLVNRLLQGQKADRSPDSREAGPASLDSLDRKELSGLMALILQELKTRPQDTDPQRTELIEGLREQLKRGNYGPEAARIAAAMLKNPGSENY